MEVYDEFGNLDLLQRRKIAFLCSRQVPAEYHGRILQWANEADRSQCVVCGCHSPLERQVAQILLNRGVPLIWVACTLAEVRAEMDSVKSYVMQERMLVLALFGPEDPMPQRQQAYMRNMSVIEHADQIVVGYRTPDGTLDHQLAGREISLEIIGAESPHRYQDFLSMEGGHISIEMVEEGGKLRIVQQRTISDGSSMREMISLAPAEAVRLRNALSRAIEANGWEESQYAEVREQYPNAYRPWSAEDELLLRQMSLEGRSEEEIAALLGRQPSAVASRLQKIIELETSATPQ